MCMRACKCVYGILGHDRPARTEYAEVGCIVCVCVCACVCMCAGVCMAHSVTVVLHAHNMQRWVAVYV